MQYTGGQDPFIYQTRSGVEGREVDIFHVWAVSTQQLDPVTPGFSLQELYSPPLISHTESESVQTFSGEFLMTTRSPVVEEKSRDRVLK